MIGIVILIAIFAFITINPGQHQFSAVGAMGYENMFENPQITFYGLSYNGHNYLANSPTQLSFDKGLSSTNTGIPWAKLTWESKGN